MLKRLLLGAALFLVGAVSASAQGYHYENTVVNQSGKPVVGAAITVCTAVATGSPCSPTVTVYSDITLTTPKTQPISTGPLGNYDFYLAPSSAGYRLSITGALITAPVDLITIPCTSGSSCGGGGGGSNYQVVQVNGTPLTTEPKLNLKNGANTTAVCVDNPGNTSTDCHLDATASSGAALGADNTFTNNNRFRGPIPNRDVSSYFPAGGCALDFPAGGLRPDPATTASINSGSAALTIVGTLSNFANGCGVAIPGAGPAATLLPPQGGVGVTLSTGNCSAIGAGWSVGTTYSTGDCVFDSHNVWYVSLQNTNTGNTPISSPTFWKPVGFIRGGGGQGQIACVTNCGFDQIDVPASSSWGIQVTGCSDSALNSTYSNAGALLTAQSGFQVITFGIGGSAESATGCSFTNLFGYAVGATGSTVDHYKIVNINDNEGFSAASSAITISNANATQDWGNYNVIQFDARDQGVVGKPVKWSAIYKAVGAGAYSCIGEAFENAFVDHGYGSFPCAPFLPATPPVAAGHETLYTTVASGGGTANLVLTATASGTVTAGNLYHDDTWALNLCLTDLKSDLGISGSLFPEWSSTAGCIVPPGNYAFEGPITAPLGTAIVVNGGINILTQPLFVAGQTWYCPVGSNKDVSEQGFLACPIRVGFNVPAVFVSTWGSGLHLDGFEAQLLLGYGLYITNNLNTAEIKHLAFQQASRGGPVPAPILIGGNALGIKLDDIAISVNAGGNPAIEFSDMPYAQNTNCCINISNFYTTFGNILVEAPGVAYAPTGFQTINVHVATTEGVNGSFVEFDNRLAAPGAAGVASLYMTIDGGPFADASTDSLFHTYDNNGTNTVHAADETGGAGKQTITCGPNTRLPNLPVCTDIPTFLGHMLDLPAHLPTDFSYILSGDQWRTQVPVNFQIPNTKAVSTVINWQQMAANPRGLSVVSTGAGSLPAANYCVFTVGEDGKNITFPGYFVVPGTTDISNEVCQTVGASSSITLEETMGNAAVGNYSNHRLYYGTAGPGSEAHYIETGNTGPLGFVFTTTSGNIAGTAADAKKDAAISYMYDNLICLGCRNPTTNQIFIEPISIGTHPWDTVSKVDILGGLNLYNGYLSGLEFTAPAGVGGVDDLWADSTAHRWKMKNNNGTADTIVGAATTDVLTNKTLDTAGAGNVFKINGTTLSSVSGNSSIAQLETGTATSGNLVKFDANGNTSDSGVAAATVAGGFTCVNVTPVTVSANTSADQTLMACSVTAGTLNALKKTLLVQSAGVYSTPAGSTTTVTVKLKLCTVSGCGSGTVLTLASWTSAALGAISVTNDPFNATANFSTQTAGASAAFESHGNLTIDISALATAAEGVYADNNTATVGTIDSTATLFLQETVAFSAASASNSATQRQLIVDSVD